MYKDTCSLIYVCVCTVAFSIHKELLQINNKDKQSNTKIHTKFQPTFHRGNTQTANKQMRTTSLPWYLPKMPNLHQIVKNYQTS